MIENMKIESKKKKGVRKKLRNKMKRGEGGGGGLKKNKGGRTHPSNDKI
jgi:hypothetical protein